MRRTFIAAALVCAVFTPVPTQAGVLSSDNVTLLATIPAQGAIAGRSITAPNGKPYFIVSEAGGVSAFDITNPELPVLAAHLELPHFENEDSDYCGGYQIVVRDPAFNGVGGLYLIDYNALPLLTMTQITVSGFRGNSYSGSHTAAFADTSCNYIYATAPGGAGSGGTIISVANKANPQVVKQIATSMLPDGVHDFELDSAGVVWAAGDVDSQNVALTAMNVSNPVNPTLIARARTGHDLGRSSFNHNMKRPRAAEYAPRPGNHWTEGATLAPGEKVFVTNEDYISPLCRGQGEFGTAHATNFTAGETIDLVDTWNPGLGDDSRNTGTQLDGEQAVPAGVCSAHWFDVRSDADNYDYVAIGWYQQGTRILRIDPKGMISQVGYFLSPVSLTWGAYWITPNIVYSLDTSAGINVLRVNADASSPEVLTTGAFASLPAAPLAGNSLFTCVRRL